MPNRPVIWTVCKDPGGTSNLLPVLPILRGMGFDVQVFLSDGGKGELALKAANESYSTVRDATELITTHPLPEGLITTMCSGGGVGRDLIPVLRALDIPTIALQDFWGARIATDFSETEFHPDLICVNDVTSRKIIQTHWGAAEGTDIVVTGYPRLDQLANFDKESARHRAWTSLQVEENSAIVFYAGQIWHAGEMLSELVTALNNLSIRCQIIANKHPRMNSEAPEAESALWQDALSRFRGKILTPPSVNQQTIYDMLCASNVVVGQYSTIQVDASVLRRPNISMLYPGKGASMFQKETGGVMPEFPLVTMGCSRPAENTLELQAHIESIFLFGTHSTTAVYEKEAQIRNFRLDGKNAERVAEIAQAVF